MTLPAQKPAPRCPSLLVVAAVAIAAAIASLSAGYELSTQRFDALRWLMAALGPALAGLIVVSSVLLNCAEEARDRNISTRIAVVLGIMVAGVLAGATESNRHAAWDAALALVVLAWVGIHRKATTIRAISIAALAAAAFLSLAAVAAGLAVRARTRAATLGIVFGCVTAGLAGIALGPAHAAAAFSHQHARDAAVLIPLVILGLWGAGSPAVSAQLARWTAWGGLAAALAFAGLKIDARLWVLPLALAVPGAVDGRRTLHGRRGRILGWCTLGLIAVSLRPALRTWGEGLLLTLEVLAGGAAAR